VKNARLCILKELFLEYQRAPCLDTFEKILKRVDNFILYMVKNLKHSRYYLNTVGTGDLYQVGVIGIYDAISSFKPEDSCSMIPARMKICIRKAIAKSYRCYRKEIVMANPHESNYEDILGLDFVFSEDKIYEKDEIDLVVRHIGKLLTSGVLSKDDIFLIRERILLGKPLYMLAEVLGVSGQCILNRTARLKNRIISSISTERLDMRIRKIRREMSNG